MNVGVGGSAYATVSVHFRAVKQSAPTMSYATTTSRMLVPTVTEWAEATGFGASRNGGNEIAFTWIASAEL